MFLIFDVEMVEYFFLFGFGHVWVVVFWVEFAFPDVYLVIFLLDQTDQIFILVDEMSVLSQQQLDLILQIIDLFGLPHMKDQLLVDSGQLELQLPSPSSPIFWIRSRVWNSGGRILSSAWTGCSRIALIGRIVMSIPKITYRAASHVWNRR